MKRELVRRFVVLGLMGVLLLAGCSNDDDTASPVGDDTVTASTTEQTDPEPPETTQPEPTADLDELESLWDQLWLASGRVAEEREAAVAEIADSLDPAVAATIPDFVPVPEAREVLTAPVFTTESDGSVTIRDCVLYTPPIIGVYADHIHEGRAMPDGDGGWIIERAERVGRGCIPAAMAETILDDYAEYIQAFKDSGNPPDPDHPSLAKTMTGQYLENIAAGAQQFVDEGWYYEDFDLRHPEIVQVRASTVVIIRDCVEADPASGIFQADGSRRDGAVVSELGDRRFVEVRMRWEGGQWKTEENDQVGTECEIAPTPAALPRI